MYPFIYWVGEKKWVVSIANPFGYSPSDERWQQNPAIGDRPLVPSMDLLKEQHEFSSEPEALKFVQKWWSEQDIDSWYDCTGDGCDE